MKPGANAFGAADRRLLPEGRLTGPMPWVIAIMMFLTVLAAAAGLGLGNAARSLAAGNRITIQIVDANPERRAQGARAALALLNGWPGVTSARQVPNEEMRQLLEPWLGEGGMEAELPIPAMIDAELSEDSRPAMANLSAQIRRAVPSARIDDHAQWLAPLGKLIGALKWLAAALVLLMAAATAATVILAARAALDTHRGTIEVLHLMGATDGQVARLFQRRIALDALFGGAIGLLGALLILWLIGERVSALGSELIGSVALPATSWIVLALLPAAGVALAMLVARLAILRALGRLT